MNSDQSVKRLLQFLSDPASYPHRPDEVRIVQTHASIVALVPPYVFKVKKPVNFGFLDFSSLEKRRFYCSEEVRLNRRLCPGLYIGVLPLTEEADGRWQWSGRGSVIDYAVVMHYLPPEGFANVRLDNGTLQRWHLEMIARRLAHFYQQADRSAEIAEWGKPEKVKISTDENIEQTREFAGKILTALSFDVLTAYTQQWYSRLAPLFDRRIAGGWIRDCHGDLRLEHIYIEDDAVCIYDCIEFNERLRWIDVAADIAFLVMDFFYHQSPRYGHFFLHRMQHLLDDAELRTILPFYLVYRAWVRAKVECLKSRELELPEEERSEVQGRARRFFRIALRTALFGIEPTVVIVMGKIGSGKTTFASALSQELGWHHFSSDAVRKEMRGLPLLELPPPEVRTRIYRRSVSARVYRQLLWRAAQATRWENGAIVEGTFSQRRARAEARSYLRRYGITPVFLHLTASEENIRQRLEVRRSQPVVSDARLAEFESLTPFFEPPQSDEPDVITLSTDQPVEETLRQCFQQLVERQIQERAEAL